MEPKEMNSRLNHESRDEATHKALGSRFGNMAGTYPMLRTSASVPEIGLPGRISAGFWSGKPQNLLSGLILKLSRLESGRDPARKPDFLPGSTIS